LSIFEKNFFVKIASFVAAVVIWFTVSISVYPVYSRDILGVPVEIRLSEYHEANSLEVINQNKEYVDITITGERGQIGNLTADDLAAVAYTDNVRMPGSYNLSLRIECKTGKEFEVTGFVDPRVAVEFDEIITRHISVGPLTYQTDLKPGDGVSIDPDEIVITPDSVSVTGPRNSVEKIAEAKVRVMSDDLLSNTYDYVSSELILYGENGAVIRNTDGLTFGRKQFDVHIPVTRRQTLELSVRVTNAPESFNTEAFSEKLIFSDYLVEVSAPSEYILDIREIDIGEIDMRSVDIGEVFTFSVENALPAGYKILDGVDGSKTVTVTCPSEGLSKIELFIPGRMIQFVNRRPQYDYVLITSGFTLCFMGPADIIEQFSESDVTAVIDILKYTFEMNEGDHKPAVDFNIPAYDGVWYQSSDGAMSPKATVTVTLK
jgi:YbbR domain-containing protein